MDPKIRHSAQMVRLKRKVIVFLDNCRAHPHLAYLRAVRLYFLTANTTAKTQSCDAGIIKNLKSHYRTKLLGYMLKWHDSGKDIKSSTSPTFADAERILECCFS